MDITFDLSEMIYEENELEVGCGKEGQKVVK